MSVSATQNDRVFIIMESFRRFWLLLPGVLFAWECFSDKIQTRSKFKSVGSLQIRTQPQVKAQEKNDPKQGHCQ